MSGLGADERAFVDIDFSNFNPIFIKWISPNNRETIENYAMRLSSQISTKHPILIGLSFGGVMAIEIAKQINVEQIVIISSIKSKKELPFYFKWAGVLKINHLIPTSILRHTNFIFNWFFGVTSKKEKFLLKQMLFETNPLFLKWSIKQILNWKNETIIDNLTHIHGSSDRILPTRFFKCNHIIKHGGHFMVLNKSDDVSSKISETLLLNHPK